MPARRHTGRRSSALGLAIAERGAGAGELPVGDGAGGGRRCGDAEHRAESRAVRMRCTLGTVRSSVYTI